MLNLSTELIKNSTSLERIEHLDDLTAHLTGTDCEVWGLRAGDTFPHRLIPSDSDDYLCYMGIYPVKIATDYGQINFLTFGYEADNTYRRDGECGMLEHMYDIYVERETERIYSNDHALCEQEVVLFPRVITESGVDYWIDIAKYTWGVRDRQQLKKFLKYNEIEKHVDWSILEDELPITHYPSDEEYSTDSESSTEGEGESESESETESESSDDEFKVFTPPQPERRRPTAPPPLRPKGRRVIFESESDET